MDSILDKFSLWRVLRITAWIATFLHNTRNRNQQRKTVPLTTEELREQRRFWERPQQEGTESKNFQQDCLQLNLQQNDQQLLERRGQIQGVYPVYIPDTSMYSVKFVQEAHEATLHGGVGLTMTKVREQHWIPRLRRLVKHIVKKCPGCKRFQAVALAAPPPGLLPQDRTEGSYPFKVVGVDFGGPIKLRLQPRKKARDI